VGTFKEAFKIRKITVPNSKRKYSKGMHGISIPRDIAIFYENIYFSIERSDENILLKSGCSPRQIPNLEEYQFEDCRIKN